MSAPWQRRDGTIPHPRPYTPTSSSGQEHGASGASLGESSDQASDGSRSDDAAHRDTDSDGSGSDSDGSDATDTTGAGTDSSNGDEDSDSDGSTTSASSDSSGGAASSDDGDDESLSNGVVDADTDSDSGTSAGSGTQPKDTLSRHARGMSPAAREIMNNSFDRKILEFQDVMAQRHAASPSQVPQVVPRTAPKAQHLVSQALLFVVLFVVRSWPQAPSPATVPAAPQLTASERVAYRTAKAKREREQQEILEEQRRVEVELARRAARRAAVASYQHNSFAVDAEGIAAVAAAAAEDAVASGLRPVPTISGPIGPYSPEAAEDSEHDRQWHQGGAGDSHGVALHGELWPLHRLHHVRDDGGIRVGEDHSDVQQAPGAATTSAPNRSRTQPARPRVEISKGQLAVLGSNQGPSLAVVKVPAPPQSPSPRPSSAPAARRRRPVDRRGVGGHQQDAPATTSRAARRGSAHVARRPASAARASVVEAGTPEPARRSEGFLAYVEQLARDAAAAQAQEEAAMMQRRRRRLGDAGVKTSRLHGSLAPAVHMAAKWHPSEPAQPPLLTPDEQSLVQVLRATEQGGEAGSSVSTMQPTALVTWYGVSGASAGPAKAADSPRLSVPVTLPPKSTPQSTKRPQSSAQPPADGSIVGGGVDAEKVVNPTDDHVGTVDITDGTEHSPKAAANPPRTNHTPVYERATPRPPVKRRPQSASIHGRREAVDVARSHQRRRRVSVGGGFRAGDLPLSDTFDGPGWADKVTWRSPSPRGSALGNEHAAKRPRSRPSSAKAPRKGDESRGSGHARVVVVGEHMVGAMAEPGPYPAFRPTNRRLVAAQGVSPRQRTPDVEPREGDGRGLPSPTSPNDIRHQGLVPRPPPASGLKPAAVLVFSGAQPTDGEASSSELAGDGGEQSGNGKADSSALMARAVADVPTPVSMGIVRRRGDPEVDPGQPHLYFRHALGQYAAGAPRNIDNPGVFMDRTATGDGSTARQRGTRQRRKGGRRRPRSAAAARRRSSARQSSPRPGHHGDEHAGTTSSDGVGGGEASQSVVPRRPATARLARPGTGSKARRVHETVDPTATDHGSPSRVTHAQQQSLAKKRWRMLFTGLTSPLVAKALAKQRQKGDAVTPNTPWSQTHPVNEATPLRTVSFRSTKSSGPDAGGSSLAYSVQATELRHLHAYFRHDKGWHVTPVSSKAASQLWAKYGPPTTNTTGQATECHPNADDAQGWSHDDGTSGMAGSDIATPIARLDFGGPGAFTSGFAHTGLTARTHEEVAAWVQDVQSARFMSSQPGARSRPVRGTPAARIGVLARPQSARRADMNGGAESGQQSGPRRRQSSGAVMEANSVSPWQHGAEGGSVDGSGT